MSGGPGRKKAKRKEEGEGRNLEDAHNKGGTAAS